MQHGSLFNGIGGFQLAADWMNWTNVFSSEIDSFCNKVTKYHFPNCIQHEDIRTTDFRIYRGRVNILTGGDPCQPHSVAGKKKGKEDDRYLWPEYKRAIEEIHPEWIVNENVPGSIYNGILDEKINDLETIGYSWWPPFIIPASAVGANHKRERVWLIAYSLQPGLQIRIQGKLNGFHKAAEPFQWSEFERIHTKRDRYKLFTSSAICRRDDGIPNRVDRIKALGNAIVPQVAFEIFKAIEQFENTG